MTSKDLMKFEKAMESMEPMEVNDNLEKTLEFLKRNNSELYFPSISPYVEAFLVNLVTDTRNLRCKAFKQADRLLAEKIIEVLEMSREVFRWTHTYENGNILVYKKIFSNKIKKKPVKLSTIADRLIHAQGTALRQPHKRTPQQPSTHSQSLLRSPNPAEPNIISFKLRFLEKTLRFVKSSQTKLSYEEMPLSQAEYIYNLLKYRDKDEGFGYKSLYASLWEAMEEHDADCNFEVTLKEISGKEMASLLLEKVPKNSNISKKGKEKPVTNNKVSEIKNKVEVQKVKNLSNSSQKENKDCNIQTEQTLSNSFLDPYYADAATAVPSLSLLSNITEKFFSKTVTALTDFADNENCKMKTFSQLSEGEIEFVKEVLSFAGTISVRDMFMPKYRILLWKLDRIVKRARHTCELTYTVVEKDRSITWIKRQKSASAISTSADTESSPLPPLELLTNITEDFFKETVKDLTHFADDATIASWTFCQLTGEQILFVKNIRQLAGTTRIRELFDSNYRDMLWRLNYSINEAASTSKITSSVNEKERSITLKKTPKFAAPAPVPPKVQPNVATGTRSKSMGQMKTTDRSLSRDRLIQFEKGGKTTDTIDLTVTTDDAPKQKPERGRSMNRRTAKLLEDLATPVESDIGMRMMMLMGWQGGALGVRGDGIMEPVMPNIDQDALRMHGALGARSNAIAEPVMSNIDQPKRGGLGHVPPPKIVPRKPIDFRQMLIHNLLDFLLHDDWKKDIVFKEPLVKKEQKFLNNLLTSVNRRRKMSLTEKENELIAKMYSRLADYPTVELKGELSQDLKTITLQKLVDRPLRGIIKIPKSKIPPTPPPLQPAPQACKADVELVISRADVANIYPHIDVAQMEVPATPQNVRKRALRLLFLTKLAEALSWDWWDQITFKYEHGGIPEFVTIFIRTAIVHLNKRDTCLSLYGVEEPMYKAMLETLSEDEAVLAIEFNTTPKFVLTRTKMVKEISLPTNFVKFKITDKNKDKNVKSVNSNQDVKVNDKKEPHEKDTPKELNDDRSNGIETNNLKDTASANIDGKIKGNIVNKNSAGSNRVEERFIETTEYAPKHKTKENIDMDLNNNKDDFLTKKSDKNNSERTILETDNAKNKTSNIQRDYLTSETIIKVSEIKIEANDDIEPNKNKENDILMNIEEIKKEKTDYEYDNNNIINGLSDFDKDIQDLEMVLNSEIDVAKYVKKENYTHECGNDLEMTMADTDSLIIKQENDDSNLSGKRSHSNSICSQEFGPKKTKIYMESDENVVIIKPKNPDEIMTEDIIREVQTLMGEELDKSGGFLPLLKCHGAQNGGLIYSCHDDDDVAWVKKVISDANLDLEIVTKELVKKNREMLIKINSYIPLDTKKVFRKFEIYNVGLDTKFWKVSYKQESNTFVIFIVSVDEKSFKYISDENFSLYCGIDRAQFSII